MAKYVKSEELNKEFSKLYPGGHTNFRVPTQAEENRIFVSKCEAGYLWDVDGNKYIDYTGALGPSFPGHRNPEIEKAMIDMLQTMGVHVGSSIAQCELDNYIAETIIKCIPCAEQIKFAITGSDAVQVIFRLSRAYTGKNTIVRFAGHYHGWGDNVLGGRLNPDKNAKPHPVEPKELNDWADTEGRSIYANQESFLLPWNDFERLEDTFKKYGDEIACVHFEGVVANNRLLFPKPGFLEKIRELCTKYNAVMSIDEVITGWRCGLGGAQAFLGVGDMVDICSMGKALSGGLPVSCVAGRKKIMEYLRHSKVISAGTSNGYLLGQAMVAANLKYLTANNGAIYKHVEAVQNKIVNGMDAIIKKTNFPMTLTSVPGMFAMLYGIPGGLRTLYTDDELAGYRDDLATKFHDYMREEGVLIMFGFKIYLMTAHTMEDADKTLVAFERSLERLKKDL